MKRLGKFTGTIYGEEVDTKDIKECCLIITDEQAKDDKFIGEKYLSISMDCICCAGCEAATFMNFVKATKE